MAIMQEASGLWALPEWLGEQVPTGELVQWVQGVGVSGGLDKPAVYLLGGVLDGYVWQQSAAWSWAMARWSLAQRSVSDAMAWAEQGIADLQRAVHSWGDILYWIERRTEPGMAEWGSWIVQRQQQLAELSGRLCQECAVVCEQRSYAWPSWLVQVVELGAGGQRDPGRS